MAGLDRRALQTMPVLVYHVDLDGRVVASNRDAARKKPAERTLAEALRGVVPEDRLQQSLDALRDGTLATAAWEAGDGVAPVLVQAVATRSDDTADVDGFVVTVTPLPTSRDLRRGTKRDGARAERDTGSEVAAALAQELRAPLLGISSAAQLLRFGAREDPTVEKSVGRILREVERLNRMVAALLELGRASAPRLSAGNPDDIWDDVLESARGELESKALHIERHSPAAPARCAFDGEQLAHLLAHVLEHAVDAAPEATSIRIASTTVDEGAWRCELHHDGDALDEETLARAFDILHSGRAGTPGMGLALARRIVDAHGGTVAIRNADGGGVTLTITLPAAR